MWLWILATLCAFFIKGLCGFANTLVFTSILGFGVNNVIISPVEVLIGYPTNFVLTWKHRKDLKPKICIPLMVLVLAGSLPGAILLKNIDAHIIKIIFGVVVILIGSEMLATEYNLIHPKKSKVVLLIVGLLSGALCGLFGVGALLAAYVNRTTENASEFKANLSIVFCVENTFRIVLYTILGVINLEALKMTALMIPFMAVALWAGMKSAEILDEKKVKKLAIVLLIISGFALIAKSF